MDRQVMQADQETGKQVKRADKYLGRYLDR